MAKTKTVNGTSYPASDFLVVEDAEKPDTWHLQVKRNGTPDHGLMGAAFAALTSGYRGNTYEGPNKQAALTKLKALYKAEGMALPSATKADQSLGETMDAVRSAVYDAVRPSPAEDLYPCVEDVYDAYLIMRLGEAYYQIDYTIAADGTVMLADRAAWVPVEEVWQPLKASRRHSAVDQTHLDQAMHHLHQAGARLPAGTYPQHDMRPIGAKAGVELDDSDTGAAPYASLKAVGDRLLEVKVAYYGHKNGFDSHGEYFSAKTDFDPENFPTPPLLYYHGYSEDGKKMGKPAVTGNFISRRAGNDGHYLTYKLRNSKYADRQWDAALKGACVVSPGTIGHLIRKAADGHLDYWPLAEVSAWDYAANRKPANLHSVAAPVLKALYLEEGLALPAAIERTAPETGEPVSAGAADISPDDASKAIARAVADALLTLHHNKGTA